MRVQCHITLFIVVLVMNDMIDLIACRNQKIKIFVPERINHVHHHHVKKVPVYIVTREKPVVMHASHIEDDDHFDEDLRGKSPKTRPEYDSAPIAGVYIGDESHVHEDPYVTDDRAPRTKISYALKHAGDPDAVKQHRNNYYLPQHAKHHHSRLTFYK